MIFKMLALNIDGTLLKPNGKLTKSTKEAIRFVKEKDVQVTLVTSRNFSSAKKVASALKINSYLVTHSGAFISKSIDDPIHCKRISENDTFDIVQFLEFYQCNIRILHERYSIGNRFKGKNNLVAKAVLGVNDPLFYPIQFVETLSDHLIEQPVSTPKIDVYFNSQKELLQAKEEITAVFQTIDAIQENDLTLEIVPKGVSKRNGLKLLANHLGYSLNQVVVIGDSIGDMEMIRDAGLGVAMWDSKLEVKKCADWITRSNNQDGVPYMIKEHFRKQLRMDFLKKLVK